MLSYTKNAENDILSYTKNTEKETLFGRASRHILYVSQHHSFVSDNDITSDYRHTIMTNFMEIEWCYLKCRNINARI